MFVFFPNEVTTSIFGLLGQEDLVKAALSSSYICDIAQSFLYMHLVIVMNNFTILETLARNPRLSHHVRTLNIVVNPVAHQLAQFHHTISTALVNLTNLRSLSISIMPLGDSSTIFPRNETIFLPQLHTIELPFVLDANLVAFLEGLPQLVHLTLDHPPRQSRGEITLPSSLAPDLEVFRGDLDVARTLVPHRPVHVILLTSGNCTAGTIQTLARSSVPVRILDITIDELPFAVLEEIARMMPRLAYLRITSIYKGWDKEFTPAFVVTIGEILDRMDHIISATISGLMWKWTTGIHRVATIKPFGIPYLSYADDEAEAVSEVGDVQWAYGNHY